MVNAALILRHVPAGLYGWPKASTDFVRIGEFPDHLDRTVLSLSMRYDHVRSLSGVVVNGWRRKWAKKGAFRGLLAIGAHQPLLFPLYGLSFRWPRCNRTPSSPNRTFFAKPQPQSSL